MRFGVPTEAARAPHSSGIFSLVVKARRRVTREGINSFDNDNRSGVASLVLKFDQDVTISSATALNVVNQTTGEALDISAAELRNNGTTEVTWDFSNVNFPDGYYSAQLSGSAVVNIVGRELSESHTVQFHKLAGDGNGDGQVGFADLPLFVNNFSTIHGPIFGPGDLDGNGDVDFADFGILASSFNNVLSKSSPTSREGPEFGKPSQTSLVDRGISQVVGSRNKDRFLLDSQIGAATNPRRPVALREVLDERILMRCLQTKRTCCCWDGVNRKSYAIATIAQEMNTNRR